MRPAHRPSLSLDFGAPFLGERDNFDTPYFGALFIGARFLSWHVFSFIYKFGYTTSRDHRAPLSLVLSALFWGKAVVFFLSLVILLSGKLSLHLNNLIFLAISR
jgi:hypothetical protein